MCEDVKDGDIPPGVLRYVIYNKNTKCGAPTNNVACFKKLVVKFFNVPTADGLRDITIYKDRDLAPVLVSCRFSPPSMSPSLDRNMIGGLVMGMEGGWDAGTVLNSHHNVSPVLFYQH